MGGDRLSDLPDDILHHILSYLPTRAQVATSLLSRRWRHLWAHNPVLRLSDGAGLLQELVLFGRCIRHWQAPLLRRLDIHFSGGQAGRFPGVSGHWFLFAESKSVRELRVRCDADGAILSLPPTFLRCSPHLWELALVRCRLPTIPLAFPGFGALKILSLGGDSIGSDECAVLLSACPLLESLTIAGCPRVERLTVSSALLKTLKVYYLADSRAREVDRLITVAAAPNLRTIGFFVPHLSMLSINCGLSSLTEATLRFFDESKTPRGWTPMALMSPVSHVEVLHMDLVLLKLLANNLDSWSGRPAMFKNVKELHLDGLWVHDSTLDALGIFLRECPFLEKLCFMLHDGRSMYDLAKCLFVSRILPYQEYVEKIEHDGKELWRPFMGIEHYMLPYLRQVKIIGFLGTKNQISIAKFLLERATIIKSLRLYHCGRNYAAFHELYLCPRASPDVEFLVQEDYQPKNELHELSCFHMETILASVIKLCCGL